MNKDDEKTTHPTQQEAFQKLGIHKDILRVIVEEQFEEPSEIQEKAIPLILQDKDVIAKSATGSGKTLAFCAGALPKIVPQKGMQALILTPTRELAEQVGKSFKKFSKYLHVRTAIIYGGVSLTPQMNELQRAEIVVGTPGRILDHLARRTLNLTQVKVLVLDEADRMLDMGFLPDVEEIIAACPKQRQTLLFSATVPSVVAKLAHKYMHAPHQIAAEAFVDPAKLTQIYYDVYDDMKLSLLIHLLKEERSGLVMVFCNARRIADIVTHNLEKNGIDALAIHGGLSQARRNMVLERFNTKRSFVLVCTDVAARGLDIPGVSHVYNYDLPIDSQQYIHRIGRTARAGAEGMAISLLARRDYDAFERIIRDNRQFHIVKQVTPQVQRLAMSSFKRPEREGFQHRGQRGPPQRRFGGRSDQGRPQYGRSGSGRPPQRRHDGGQRFSRR